MLQRFGCCLAVLQMVLVLGCSGPPVPKGQVPTFPVSGAVTIDGKPTAGVMVFLCKADVLTSDQLTPTSGGGVATGLSDAEGKFKISTYKNGDGAPEGSYVVAFYWDGGYEMPAMRAGERSEKIPPIAQKFNLKYSTPANSEFKITVEKGKPNELGPYDLSTKKK